MVYNIYVHNKILFANSAAVAHYRGKRAKAQCSLPRRVVFLGGIPTRRGITPLSPLVCAPSLRSAPVATASTEIRRGSFASSRDGTDVTLLQVQIQFKFDSGMRHSYFFPFFFVNSEATSMLRRDSLARPWLFCEQIHF